MAEETKETKAVTPEVKPEAPKAPKARDAEKASAEVKAPELSERTRAEMERGKKSIAGRRK